MSEGYSAFQRKFNKSRVETVNIVSLPRIERIKRQSKSRERKLREETKRRKKHQRILEEQRKVKLEEERKQYLEKRRKRMFSASKYIRKDWKSKVKITRQFTARTETLPKIYYKENDIPMEKTRRVPQQSSLPLLKQETSRDKQSIISDPTISAKSEYEKHSISLKEASCFIKSLRYQLNDISVTKVNRLLPETEGFDANVNIKKKWNTRKNLETDETRKKVCEIRRKEYDLIVQNMRENTLLKRQKLFDMEEELEASIAQLDKQLENMNERAFTKLPLISNQVMLTNPKEKGIEDGSLTGCLLEVDENKENLEKNAEFNFL